MKELGRWDRNHRVDMTYLLAFHQYDKMPLTRKKEPQLLLLGLHSHLAPVSGPLVGENILEAAGARTKLLLAGKKQRELAFMIKPLPQTH